MPKLKIYDTVVIGGGAAGFFFAINYKLLNPDKHVVILEKSKDILGKVKVSGGGRCNVTHACFEPKELVKFYPRGNKELIGPFHKFQPGDTIQWFADRGIELKIEEDGRMFPVTDASQTIVDCFLKEASENNVEICTGEGVTDITRADDHWSVQTNTNVLQCSNIFMAAGSSRKMWDILSRLGHTVVDPVPSLFTFNIKDPRINGLMGLSVSNATVSIPKFGLEETGPVLITHWGLSGPGILKLSSVGARKLNHVNYAFQIKVNWNGDYDHEDVLEMLLGLKTSGGKQKPHAHPAFDIPKRLWKRMLEAAGIRQEQNWADIPNVYIEDLATEIASATFRVDGKSTFKEEFVTAGGIDLKEVDFRTMRSKRHEGLYFAGEILNIDALTGGFNFQAAWTGAWIAANNIEG